ncbi:MAG TPA: SRPBCC domain-containing protein [Steroidobacteraceae bacterium]|nr:SRPBCC domain-containing protein [Steroidobacteraceae bacterium]
MTKLVSERTGALVAGEKAPTDREVIVTECELAAAPETVWRALTEPDLLAAWLLPNDIRPERGASFTLKSPAGLPGERIDCQVLDAERPRLLRYTWRSAGRPGGPDTGSDLDTTVTFELFPTSSGGTRLRVSHAGFPASVKETVALRASQARTCGAPRALLRAA